MNIETYWLNASRKQRCWVMRDLGWRQPGGAPNSTALDVSRSPWEKVPEAIQNILRQKAREGSIG